MSRRVRPARRPTRPTRVRRGTAVTVGAAVVVVVASATVAVTTVVPEDDRAVAAPGKAASASATPSSGGGAPKHTADGRPTAPVVRGDLTERRTFAGTLGHGTPKDLLGSGSGTLTGLPDYGQVVHRDEALYWRDERPVRAMHGAVPLWRPLERGLRGTDVAQLNRNLAALGYDVAQDDRFGTRTAAAVRQWQRDRGFAVTGRLTADDIAFVDGDVRVAEPKATVGSPASGPLYGYTSTTRTVTVPIDELAAGSFPVGSTVSVGFSGSTEHVDGTVRSVGADPSSDDGGLVVEIDLRAAVPSGVAEAAGVDVQVEGETRKGVLSVPVGALLAARGDGYAVDRVRASGETERVPVEVGFAADGRVEVSGGVHEGDRVVVPS
ncbi:peptidoglycan-binding protein [Curtobacterium sp. MCBD17_035]|uniref:peptidoglycan-binding protein n=1 Tax=Curtobacterium sp. MCBD17_035 TaxID=2175673 RepID=UPI000DAA004A|nr:peptidoglycan-binding protein [Curtobacterium sp. MCBD17_035]WIB67921.1 peptidoglycan-binding protein [Curtobacterium sp. MCBD17_035]